MVKVEIQYICDKCKKIKKEKIITIKGYDDVGYAIENMEAAFMPSGWTVKYTKSDKPILMCKTCSKEDYKKNGDWEAVAIA